MTLMFCLRRQQAPDTSAGTWRDNYKAWDNVTVPTLGREGENWHHSQRPARTHCKWEKTPPQSPLLLSSHLAKVAWDPSEKLKEKEYKHSSDTGEQMLVCIGYCHFRARNISNFFFFLFFFVVDVFVFFGRGRAFKSYIYRNIFSKKPRRLMFGYYFLIVFTHKTKKKTSVKGNKEDCCACYETPFSFGIVLTRPIIKA